MKTARTGKRLSIINILYTLKLPSALIKRAAQLRAARGTGTSEQVSGELRSSQKYVLPRRFENVACLSYTTSGATPARRIFGRTLRAGLLRAIRCVEAFAKVSTFTADFALHLIPQKYSAAIMDLFIGSLTYVDHLNRAIRQYF